MNIYFIYKYIHIKYFIYMKIFLSVIKYKITPEKAQLIKINTDVCYKVHISTQNVRLCVRTVVLMGVQFFGVSPSAQTAFQNSLPGRAGVWAPEAEVSRPLPSLRVLSLSAGLFAWCLSATPSQTLLL